MQSAVEFDVQKSASVAVVSGIVKSAGPDRWSHCGRLLGVGICSQMLRAYARASRADFEKGRKLVSGRPLVDCVILHVGGGQVSVGSLKMKIERGQQRLTQH